MSFTSFQEEVLKVHNELRAKHSSPPLKLTENLCNYAQEWANTLASSGKLQHRTERKYGENLYYCGGKAATAQDAVNSWYSEIKKHTFGEADPGNNWVNVGHFTQVVWQSSKELGVGVAVNGTKSYVVCNYDPAGNARQKFGDNVKAQ